VNEHIIEKLRWRLEKSEEFLAKYAVKIDRYGWNAGYDQAIREEIIWLKQLLETVKENA
jgi:hypothetical protein